MSETMRHFQGWGTYRPVKSKIDRTRQRPITVAVLAHGKDGYSSIQFEDGSIQRVSTAYIRMNDERP